MLLFHWYQFFPSAAAAVRPDRLAGTLVDPTVYLGFGWMGVPLFFVLSGYLLGGQVVHAKLTGAFLKRFWLRRILRIYPAVWAELVVLLILGTAVDGLISKQGMDSLVFQFLLWVNLPPNMVQPINGVWWTLPVELGFYLVLPMLGLFARLAGWRVLLVGAGVLTLAWRGAWFLSSDTDNFLTILPILDSLPGVFWTFILGFSLNFLPSHKTQEQCRRGVVLSMCILLALMQWQLCLNDVYWKGHWILVIWTALTAVPITGFVYFLSNPPSGWNWLENRYLVWLGHVSFGIYLWHFQVMRLLALIFPEAWNSPFMSLIALAISLPSTLILASVSYYLIEKPLMGWGKNRL